MIINFLIGSAIFIIAFVALMVIPYYIGRLVAKISPKTIDTDYRDFVGYWFLGIFTSIILTIFCLLLWASTELGGMIRS